MHTPLYDALYALSRHDVALSNTNNCANGPVLHITAYNATDSELNRLTLKFNRSNTYFFSQFWSIILTPIEELLGLTFLNCSEHSVACA